MPFGSWHPVSTWIDKPARLIIRICFWFSICQAQQKWKQILRRKCCLPSPHLFPTWMEQNLENCDNIRRSSCESDENWYEVKQVQPVWLWQLWCKWFGGTFESAHLKVEQMQPMWLCILSGRQFKETFENAQWRKVEQIQPINLLNFQQFETFESNLYDNDVSLVSNSVRPRSNQTSCKCLEKAKLNRKKLTNANLFSN